MRIRAIKPEFWRSDDIDALCIADRLLFVGLWSYVDDSGVGVDKESAIAADLFAGDLERDPSECSVRVHGGLKRLAAANLITRYTVKGRRYLHITTWSRHQKINRPTESRHPSPACDDAAPTEFVSEDSVSPHAPEQGNRGTGEQGIYPAGPVDLLGHVGQRASARDTSSRAHELNGKAQSARAYRLVKKYRDSREHKVPTDVLNHLGRAIDTLYADGFEPETIEAGVDDWAEKNLGPGALASVVAQLVADPNRPVPVPTDPAAALSDKQVDEILGDYAHMDPPPDDVFAQGQQAVRAWILEREPAWREARRQEARDVLRRRASMRAAAG